jgi:hypothetical protein
MTHHNTESTGDLDHDRPCNPTFGLSLTREQLAFAEVLAEILARQFGRTNRQSPTSADGCPNP